MTEKDFPMDDITEKICNILAESEIRFCGLIDNKGNLVAGDFSEGITPYETDENRQKMYQELSHRVGKRQGFDSSLGKVKYSASRRENVVMMSFPLKQYILMIIAEPGVNIDRLGWKIIKKLDQQWGEFYGS